MPTQLGEVPILQLHDRSDLTIPWEGGMTRDGWIYEAEATVLATWARVHGCTSNGPSPFGKGAEIATPFDGGAAHMSCHGYKTCGRGKKEGRNGSHAGGGKGSHAGGRKGGRKGGGAVQVGQCFFDGAHGSWPRHIEALIVWFLFNGEGIEGIESTVGV